MHPSHSYTMLVIAVTLAFVFVVALLLYERSIVSTIANVDVPNGLHCEEDETIFWTGIDTLGCVHAGLIHDHAEVYP